MFLAEDWEMFYTESKTGEDCLVDQISIDIKRKKYILEIDTDDRVTDGCDSKGKEIYSSYVSRFVFDIIVQAIKENEDFTEIFEY
ncbi:MAG: hypothetical protein J1F32_06235 [Erysipelotrichales bacterium]|nr:hypothetical protein [Erysipelotrichales bacterium]